MKRYLPVNAFLFCLFISHSLIPGSARAVDCIDYNVFSPRLVNTHATGGSAQEMEIVGDLGYLVDLTMGFSVWDVTDPYDPVQLSSLDIPSQLTGVWVSGDFAYLSDAQSGVLVIDISNPLAPSVAGSIETPGQATDVTGSGNLLCIADRQGMTLIDVSDPSSPQLLGQAVVEYCRDVAISGNTVFAGNWGGIRSFDISDPANPVFLSRLEGAGQVLGMSVVGDLAYLSAASDASQPCTSCGQFSVVDISNPQSMVLLGTTYTAGSGYDVKVSEGFAYVPDYAYGLILVDVKDPSQPIIESYAASTWSSVEGLGVGLKDGAVIVCGGDDGLLTYDLSGPVTSDALPIPGWMMGFEAKNGLAYIGTGYYDSFNPWIRTGLQIVDISDPTNLEPLGALSFTQGTSLMAVADPVVYLSGYWSRTFYVVDAADPLNPVEIAQMQAPGRIIDSVISGDFLVVAADSAGVLIYDISSPRSPTLLSQVPLPGTASEISIVGSRIYVTGFEYGLMAVDWSDPATPLMLGSIQIGTTGSLLGVRDSLAYVGDRRNGGIMVLDVSKPGEMAIISAVDFGGMSPGYPLELEFRGDTGYVATIYNGILVADFSDPITPRVVKKVDLPFVYFMQLVGDDLMALSWERDLQIGSLHALPLDCQSLSAVEDRIVRTATMFSLQNHPNPFNPLTTISFDLAERQRVNVDVYDLRGRLVQTLIAGEIRSVGHHSVTWNGRDAAGHTVGAGVYFYRLDTEGHTETRRMTLLK